MNSCYKLRPDSIVVELNVNIHFIIIPSSDIKVKERRGLLNHLV